MPRLSFPVLRSSLPAQFLFSLTLVIFAALSGCGGGGNNTPPQPTKTLTAVQVTPANQSVVRGTGQQFTATGTFSDGSTQDLTSTVSWSVSNAAVVSVNASGAASTLAPGRSKITATSSGVGASTNLIVVADSSATMPRFAFAANSDDGTLSMYTVNAATSQLRHNGYVFTGTTPMAVAVDPMNSFVYVANNLSNDVSGYKISSDGTLVAVAGSPFAATTNPAAVIVEPSGTFVYVANEGGSLVTGYSMDRSTGALTLIANFPTGTGPRALAVDSLARFLYVANGDAGSVSAFAIDPASGALTAVTGSPFATRPTVSDPSELVMDPAGKTLFVSGPNANAVAAFAITSATGALASVVSAAFPLPAGSFPSSMAVDLTGKFLYVANAGGANVAVLAINPGVLTPVAGSPFATGESPSALAVDPSGKFLYAVNGGFSSQTITAFATNSTTGALTAVTTVRSRGPAHALALAKGTAPVSYTPLFTYVLDANSNDVRGYSINTSTGVLTQLSSSPFTVPANSDHLAINPSGNALYVASGTTISELSVNQSTGVLTPIAGSPFPTISAATWLAVDPTNRFLYSVTFGSNITGYAIAPSTGSLTPLTPAPGNFGNQPGAIVFDPSGRFVATSNQNANSISLFTVDLHSGLLALDGTFTAGTTPFGAPAFDPSGRFVYAANGGSSSVCGFALNPNTNQLTPVPGSPFAAGQTPSRVAVEPSGRFAYVTNGLGEDVSAYSIDPLTGALTQLPGSPFAALAPALDVAIDASGKFLYTASAAPFNEVTAFTIDQASGVLNRLPGPPFVTGDGPIALVVSGKIQ
jgi:6-phosphogluconolactonase (cycloisomerase 2 family)